MISSYEIIPQKGLGDLAFGMDMEKVVSDLGEPEEVDNFESEEEMNAVLLYYWEKGVSIFFEGHTRQVVAGMETDHPDATLYGKKIIGMPQKEAIALMKANGAEEFDEEQEDGETRLSFEEQMIDFYIRDGKVAFVNWDVIVDSDGNVAVL
ncbi:MAG: hypothetical protein JXR65_08380 [Bacteroidales bacterium]|nr:hypothetical protein [Bacteroidales bacterium]